jgi:hypothetical protein
MDLTAERTDAAARMRRLDARLALMNVNSDKGLKIRTPEENDSRRWEASWWNPQRTTRAYDTEADLLEDMYKLFGRPGGEE